MSRKQKSFFIKGWKLNGIGLNPKCDIKCDITSKEHFEANIEKVFGKVAKFKTTNTRLHVDTNKDLLHLCNNIFDMSSVIKNELMLWAMKGYIAQMKGCNVN